MSAAVHFLLLNGLVNKRTADAGLVAPCISLENRGLVDCHRSPVSVMFEKQTGSPVRMRTYDPFYSCCNGDVGRFRFPQSSRGNVVEIARLFGLQLSCVKVNRTWASRWYECDPVTSRRLLTNLRAAGCALLPKRILRSRSAMDRLSIQSSRKQSRLAFHILKEHSNGKHEAER